MRRPLLCLFVVLASLLTSSFASADDVQDFAVLVISRERLEVSTPCEIGVYLQDQLSGRLFQEDSVSFNLPPGKVSLRLKTLPGKAYGCEAGVIGEQPNIVLDLKAGDIRKYRIGYGPNGFFLKQENLNY